MARPREFDDATVLNALMRVFWKKGYDATSYADIMAATGLQKGSLYSAFGDKRALYAQALACYADNTIKDGTQMLSDDSLASEMRIAALFDGVIGSAHTPEGRWGCLLCNAATDQAPHDANTERQVQSSIRKLQDAIEGALPARSKSHAPLILSAYFGARTLVKAGLGKELIIAVKQGALAGLR